MSGGSWEPTHFSNGILVTSIKRRDQFPMDLNIGTSE